MLPLTSHRPVMWPPMAAFCIAKPFLLDGSVRPASKSPLLLRSPMKGALTVSTVVSVSRQRSTVSPRIGICEEIEESATCPIWIATSAPLPKPIVKSEWNRLPRIT